MTRVRDLHDEWMKDPEYRAEYDALEEEFTLAETMIRVRMAANQANDEPASTP